MDVAWLVACHIAYAWLPQQENTCDTSCTGEGVGAHRSNMCSLKWRLFLFRGEGHPSDVIFSGRIVAAILLPISKAGHQR